MTTMTTPELTETEIALKDLRLHDLNARAGSPETYEEDDIAGLAASIATLGLLNPLIVQKTGKVWGVLAGGRRRAALLRLADDKSAKGWTQRSKVNCRVLPDDTAAATAITVAENVTQKAMDPIDEFEAFARMMETGGHNPDSIARMFGVERRRVLDRLRYGRVHPEIRAAVREKKMTIDTMKAFAEHPDREVQKAVYNALRDSDTYMAAHVVRRELRDRGTRIGDALGQEVVEAYRAAGGDIVADLIDEDSILTDRKLVELCLLEKLQASAETEQNRFGFAWAEGRHGMDWQEMQKFGRIYPTRIDLDDAAQAQANDIADRMSELEEQSDMQDGVYTDELHAEWERLEAEYEALTTGYKPEDLEKSGVLAVWENGGVRVLVGLVRPEDKTPAGIGSEKVKSDSDVRGEANSEPLNIPESLAADLRTEKAVVIGSALAADPDLAQDLALFKLVTDILVGHSPVSRALDITGSVGGRPHGKPDGVDPRPGEALAALQENLDMSWWSGDSPMEIRFGRFRALGADLKARIVAVAVARSLNPSDYRWGEQLLTHVARQVVPDLRAVWRPTGEAFFGRLKKTDLLDILSNDLKQPEEAARLASGKKGDIVAYLERMFAEPFATLTPEQRAAVGRWCPPNMEVAESGQVPRVMVDGGFSDGDVSLAEEDEEIDIGDGDMHPTASDAQLEVA